MRMKLINISLIAFSLIAITMLSPFTAQAEIPMQNSPYKFITKLNGIKEYRLKNGLKVLLKENHSIPLITFSVWYKVGSRNEHKGIYGIAHFLEHMMFKGTKKYKKGEISSIIQSHGGIFNAFTSTDCTTYYETISPKYLHTVIEIEADRMKSSAIAESELNLERSVVLSELEGGLNNPITVLDQKLRFHAYDQSPYKHPTIGYEEDIKNTNSEIMKGFYRKYYNPQNSVVLLVGDFNENNALTLINKFFGSIKNEKDAFPTTLSEVNIPRDKPQLKEKRFTLNKAGTFKVIEIGYHIPDIKDKDIYPLNIIEEYLIKGKNSPLNKKLIETGLATEVIGGAEANTDPGLFYILASLTPKTTHKKVESIINEIINALIKDPPSEEEITAATNRIKADYLFNLDGTYAQVLNIGYFEAINDWKQSITWLDEISKVSRDDVSNALKKYFSRNNRTVGYFIPKLRKGEKYEPQPINITRTQHYKNTGITQLKNNDLGFYFIKSKLEEGSKLIHYKNIDQPVTYITGIIKGGYSLIPKEKEWYCEIIARTLEKGSKNYTKEDIENFLDKTGAHIDFACDEEMFKFSLASHNDNLKQTIDIFSDILMNPTFPANEINKEKQKLTAEILETKDNTAEIARRKLSQTIYPKDHPYYLNDFNEDIKLIKNIDIKSIYNIHEKIIKNNTLIISAVNNMPKTEFNSVIKSLSEKLTTKKQKVKPAVNIPDTLMRDTPKSESYFVKDKAQSDVFLAHAGYIKRQDPDFYKVLVANYVLGGSSLASRLSKRVRDNAGLVYTVYSYYSASQGKGEFGIYFGSNNNNVDAAIKLIKDEMHKFVKEGITEEELKSAKASLTDSFVSRNLSNYKNIASTLSTIYYFNLGDNYINNYPQIINSLKVSDINAAIKKYFFPDKLNIVIAGEYSQKK